MKQYKILSINVEENPESGDVCGLIELQDVLTGQIQENSIWYSEDGEHYFCYDSDETDYDGEPCLSDMLISDVSVGDIIN
jgi:hypothetical protein